MFSRRAWRATLLAGAAWIALSAAAGTAEAATVACGQPIVADTVLDRDLRCTGDGLELTTGDVTLDLAGHTIKGAGSGTGIIVRPCDRTGTLTIRNGTVKGFGTGVLLASDFGCDHTVATTIEGLAIVRNGTGVGTGIDGAHVGPTELRGNLIRANTGDGITSFEFRPLHVVGNEINANGRNGVSARVDSVDRLERNVIARNGAHGAQITDSVSAIVGNRFAGNGGIGMALSERFCPYRSLYDVSGNTAVQNRGGGMSAAFPLCEDQTVPVPGSGNVARRNANFQCLLVVCEPGATAMAAATPRRVARARHAGS